jgi:AraC-like DNA-binding protein
MIRRVPKVPGLRLLVREIWRAECPNAEAARERVLPTGEMHLVFRVSGPEVRLFESSEDRHGESVGFAVIGGPRSEAYLKRTVGGAVSIGAILNAGAAWPLFGAQAWEFAGRHVKLTDVWGMDGERALDRIVCAGSAERELEEFESLLAARLPRVRSLHPAVAATLRGIETGSSIRDVVRASGFSHRYVSGVFRQTIGFSPKLYARVRRFERAMHEMRRGVSLVDVALDCGYSDQSHLQREFREIAGITPLEYRRIAPAYAHHVPASDEFHFLQER